MPSFTHVAGRSLEYLAGRDDFCSKSSLSDKQCDTVFKVQIIYGVVIGLVSLIGIILATYLIIRQRRIWQRRKQLGLVYVPPPHNPSDPPYDPSVGRPVQNVGLPQPIYAAQPPTYSAA